MAKNLLIVESPAKAKTINKYLGKDFHVLASYGHVRDLVPKEGAVDIDNDFAMNYEVIEQERKARRCDRQGRREGAIRSISRPTLDREGEAISWHIAEILKQRGLLDGRALHRVVFSEITPRAIKEAVAQPRELSMDLVNAQQARRALDYLVGFNLSPVLWRKVQRGLSAGRVQSPALRMIVEREEEIEAFKAREYWTIEADCAHPDQRVQRAPAAAQRQEVRAVRSHQRARRARRARCVEARPRRADSSSATCSRRKASAARRRRSRPRPCNRKPRASSASRPAARCGSRSSSTKACTIGDEGIVGLITYMRTDAVYLSNDAIAEMRDVIQRDYGPRALPETPELLPQQIEECAGSA